MWSWDSNGIRIRTTFPPTKLTGTGREGEGENHHWQNIQSLRVYLHACIRVSIYISMYVPRGTQKQGRMQQWDKMVNQSTSDTFQTCKRQKVFLRGIWCPSSNSAPCLPHPLSTNSPPPKKHRDAEKETQRDSEKERELKWADVEEQNPGIGDWRMSLRLCDSSSIPNIAYL